MNRSARAYTVVGAGAIGGTIAWHLARAGHPVSVIDTDADHVAAIAADGIVLESDGRRDAQPVASASTVDAVDQPLQRVLLAVKAHATDTAAAWLAQHLVPDGYVVSMQNGLNEPVIAAQVGAERTVGAFVDLFADVVAPGVIADGGAGSIAVGETTGAPSRRVDELVADLQAWGPAVATDNVSGYLWSKLGFGAMLTATALADEAMGDLIDRHRPAAHALAREVLTIAQAERVDLLPFDAFEPDAYLPGVAGAQSDAATDRLVAWLRTQAKNRSGIWRDIAVRHRPTEVPTQYGQVLAAADTHRLSVPVLRAMLEQLAAVEADRSTMAETRLVALDRLALQAAA